MACSISLARASSSPPECLRANDSLTASVDYTEDGDLKLGMRLEGINPDRDPNQPIILNLNVDNNIPQMLRSLQAVRSIEDILERRTAN